MLLLMFAINYCLFSSSERSKPFVWMYSWNVLLSWIDNTKQYILLRAAGRPKKKAAIKKTWAWKIIAKKKPKSKLQMTFYFWFVLFFLTIFWTFFFADFLSEVRAFLLGFRPRAKQAFSEDICCAIVLVFFARRRANTPCSSTLSLLHSSFIFAINCWLFAQQRAK